MVEQNDAPLFVSTSCAQDDSCSRQIQQGLCSGNRKVVLENNSDGTAVHPLTQALILVPWGSDEDDRIACYYEDYGVVKPPTMVLDGQGATLLMENAEIPLNFMFAHGVKGMTLKNFTIASRRAYYTLGTLVANNDYDNSLTAWMQVSNTTLYPPPPSSRCDDNQHWLNRVEAIVGWDAENRRPAAAEFDMYQETTVSWLDNSCVNDNDVEQALIKLEFSEWKPWNLPTEPNSILLRHTVYDYHVFEIKLSSNVKLQDIWIQSGGGMAVVTDQIEDGLSLERVQVAPADGHVFSVVADGFHVSATRCGEVQIQDCLVESQGDDAVNIKSSYLELRDWSNNTIYYDTELDAGPAWHLLEGDTLSISRRRTFEPILNFTSIIVTKIHNDDIGMGTLILQDSLPGAVSKYDLLVNENAFPDSVVIDSSVFRNNRARGALLETDNLLVRNTSFAYTTGPGIQAVPNCILDSFCEGHVVRGNWTVEDCTFYRNDFWNWSDAVVFIGADVPLWTTTTTITDGEEEVMVPRARRQLTRGIQHRGITIKRNEFRADDDTFCDGMEKSAFIGYGIDGLLLQDNQGDCFPWTISSSCRNVVITYGHDGFTEEQPNNRQLVKANAGAKTLPSGSASKGSHGQSGTVWFSPLSAFGMLSGFVCMLLLRRRNLEPQLD